MEAASRPWRRGSFQVLRSTHHPLGNFRLWLRAVELPVRSGGRTLADRLPPIVQQSNVQNLEGAPCEGCGILPCSKENEAHKTNQAPGTKPGKPKRHPCRGLPLFSIGGSHRAQEQDDISSDADKSTQLLLQTTAPLQTQGGREGKQECRPKALQSLEQDHSTPHSDTLGQLSHVHMLSNMQQQQRNAYNAPAKPTLHTTHSRIPLRAQQVFTPLNRREMYFS